jgi:hypothetical protein
MTIELNLAPVAEWASSLPTWAWVLIAVQKWYFVAGLIIRWMVRKDPDSWKYDITEGPTPWFIWLASPAFVPVCFVWTFLWVASAGVIPPFWSKSWRD